MKYERKFVNISAFRRAALLSVSHGARHAVTKIDFDQNDHDHFDHHVTAGESTWAAKFVSFVVVNCSAPPSHGARHAVTFLRIFRLDYLV